jgi:hypothetical protein
MDTDQLLPALSWPQDQALHPSFKFTESVIRPANLGSFENETKKLGLVGLPHMAFLQVDLKLELAFEKPLNAPHDPFAGRQNLHQNDEVVCVPGETVPAFLKLLIEVVQKNVCQKRRQRTSLRDPFRGLLEASFHHHSGKEVLFRWRGPSANQAKHPFVADFTCDSEHKRVVVHGVREL